MSYNKTVNPFNYYKFKGFNSLNEFLETQMIDSLLDSDVLTTLARRILTLHRGDKPRANTSHRLT